MKHNDAELIERILEGDEHAFALLVEKYQDQIHTLVWQKIGDFHIAQEITQDVFISAYHKLATLKHRNRFSGWLYVIANRKCITWYRKKKPQPQSLEETDPMELEETYYSEHISREREEEAHEKRRALVQKLLSKLRESDKTVITLHYLAGLSCEEISKFLGVSVNTVKSRLHRARTQLKKEEAVIRESLSSFQVPKQLAENTMQEISNLQLPAPPASKPLVPWIVSGTSAIMVFLLLGVGAQYLYRFQRPYDFDATSEPTIEITEAKRVVDSLDRRTVRNQAGRPDILNRNNGASQKSNLQLVDSTQSDVTKDSKSDEITQKGIASLSGKVVDEEGNVVHGLELTVKPIEFSPKLPQKNTISSIPSSEWRRVVTDKQGSFSFSNITPVSSQLVMFPEAGSNFEIISLEIGDLTFYPTGFHANFPNWFGKPTFAIEPGISLKNMVVTVQPPRMRIRGRILLKDGTPLAKADIGLTVRQRNKDTFLFFFRGSGSSSTTGGGAKTDSQGYFVSYEPQETAEYSVSVEYEGEKVNSRWFRIKEGQRYDKLVFRLKNVEKSRKIRSERIKVQQAIWTVNPKNGHAYKKIQCNSWNDAKAKAAAENAYLVAINDEPEQKWLEARFAENLFYWIGLKISQNDTSSQWDNGQSLTYINWLTTEKSNEESTSESKVPVAMEFFSKRWMPIETDNPFLPVVKHAILEKDSMK
ncbi:MAG: sigma-70 family RNA polymerase sigma factor [Candidatus Poribacteria bacterium]|nr:sigma-70 family RNA polymerase sigma factor [Candidatus Poribacteria bacterium]